MLEKTQNCFQEEQYYYSKHARDEMEMEESGEINDHEVCQALTKGKIIENYPDDVPYPSCLIYGRTDKNRPLHVVCAYASEDDLAIVITTYQPDPDRWIEFTRRKA